MSRRVLDWHSFAYDQLMFWRQEGRDNPLVLYSGSKWVTTARKEYFGQFMADDEQIDMVTVKQHIPRTGKRGSGKTVSVYFIIVSVKNPDEVMDMLIDSIEGDEKEMKQSYASGKQRKF